MTMEKIRQKIHARTGNFVPEIVAEAVIELIRAEREACLACYSPDDTATDWADKIRARNP